jgi:hypothetical protein
VDIPTPVEHRPGKTLVLEDGISRSKHLRNIRTRFPESKIYIDESELKENQLKDPLLKEIIEKKSKRQTLGLDLHQKVGAYLLYLELKDGYLYLLNNNERKSKRMSETRSMTTEIHNARLLNSRMIY